MDRASYLGEPVTTQYVFIGNALATAVLSRHFPSIIIPEKNKSLTQKEAHDVKILRGGE
jgi:hypothetical protein